MVISNNPKVISICKELSIPYAVDKKTLRDKLEGSSIEYPILRFNNSCYYKQLDHNFKIYNYGKDIINVLNFKRLILDNIHNISNNKLIEFETPSSIIDKSFRDFSIIGRSSNSKTERIFSSFEEFNSHFKSCSTNDWIYYKKSIYDQVYYIECAHNKIINIYEKEFTNTNKLTKLSNSILKNNKFFTQLSFESLNFMSLYNIYFGSVELLYNSNTLSLKLINIKAFPDLNITEIYEFYKLYIKWLYQSVYKNCFNYRNANNIDDLFWDIANLKNPRYSFGQRQREKSVYDLINNQKVSKRGGDTHLSIRTVDTIDNDKIKIDDTDDLLIGSAGTLNTTNPTANVPIDNGSTTWIGTDNVRSTYSFIGHGHLNYEQLERSINETMFGEIKKSKKLKPKNDSPDVPPTYPAW